MRWFPMGNVIEECNWWDTTQFKETQIECGLQGRGAPLRYDTEQIAKATEIYKTHFPG